MVDDVTKAEQERSHGKVMSGIGKLGGVNFSLIMRELFLLLIHLWELTHSERWSLALTGIPMT